MKKRINLFNLYGEEFVLERVERNEDFIQINGYIENVTRVVHNKKHKTLKFDYLDTKIEKKSNSNKTSIHIGYKSKLFGIYR